MPSRQLLASTPWSWWWSSLMEYLADIILVPLKMSPVRYNLSFSFSCHLLPQTYLLTLCLGIILNSFSCVASFSDLNFNGMIDNIVLGHIKDKNEANHESSMVKQIIYNMITLTAYLGWVNLCTVKPMVTLILMCNAPIWGVGYLNILLQDWPSTPWWS